MEINYNQKANAFIKSNFVKIENGRNDGKKFAHRHEVQFIEFLMRNDDGTYRTCEISIGQFNDVFNHIQELKTVEAYFEPKSELPF